MIREVRCQSRLPSLEGLTEAAQSDSLRFIPLGVSRRLQFCHTDLTTGLLKHALEKHDQGRPLSKGATLGLQNEGLCTRCERISGQRSLGRESSRCKRLEAGIVSSRGRRTKVSSATGAE